MHDPLTFEARLGAALRRHADQVPTDVDARAFTHAIATEAREVKLRGGSPIFGGIRSPGWSLRTIVVALLVAAIAAGGVLVGSQLLKPSPTPALPMTPGVFTATGPLAEARQALTATLLSDGRVLVVGGYVVAPERGGDDTAVRQAEVWSAESGSFTAVGSMTSGRVAHTATLLPSGKVLVIGGIDMSGGLVADAEMWDPVTETFTPAGALRERRSGHTATLLPNGSVLVIGGANSDASAIASAELWDPATQTFGPAGSLRLTRADHTATLLPDGSVLVIGGNTVGGAPNVGGGDARSSVELWVPATMTFEPAGSLGVARYGHTATLLPDGRILVVGGGNGYPNEMGLASAEIWDPVTRSFSATGSPAFGRAGHTATLLPDGRVLVVGGGNSLGCCDQAQGIVAAELWNPATESFSPAGLPAHGYTGHGATLLRDGRVLIEGAVVESTTKYCSDGSSGMVPFASFSGHCTLSTTRPNYGTAAELFETSGNEP